MTKKRFLLAFLGLVAVVGCLLVLSANAKQLPSGVAQPSVKPGVKSIKNEHPLTVNTEPASQAVLTSSKVAASKTTASLSAPKPQAKAASCGTPDSSQTASLTASTSVQKTPRLLSAAQLKQGILDITGDLVQ